MSRLKNSILEKGKAYAGHSPTLDLSYGGQNGHMAAIGRIGEDGKHYDEWVSNHAYVRQNIIPVVLKYPKFFDFMPDKEKLIEAYNALMTLHPLTIEGLSSGLTVEFDEQPIGGAGEAQEEVTKVTRARTTLTKTYKEKAGKAIQKFVDLVIRYGYSDPDVEKPLVTNITDVHEDFGGMYTPDYYTGTHLYIEPDITQQQVVDAWLCTNVMFKGNGERTGKRDIHSPRETLDITLEFTSITMNNEAVLRFADSVLKKLTVLKSNPELDMVIPQSEVDALLEETATGYNSVDYNSVPGRTGDNGQ